ncbi:hypothetical protein NP233_g9779 [Leucocoprinus birnbaumii]|uniref:Protein kinase domain-containing protein n=1 Tax=Leucocoprinus birnbaumii TaxID=56174 RepID=A0AAD5VKH7_9AGAR|nr:hypothetical protein NP233_g9779 [Leucocoprinus birnbaumii]
MPLVHDVINGLTYLHDENIIHADLKGVNVLVNCDGEACISDFGLASVFTNNTFGHTDGESMTPGCSYRWLAPESFNASNRRTKASDVWALGGVIYEVLNELDPPNSWFRKHCLIVLYKLSTAFLIYPQCFLLTGITSHESYPVKGGGFADIYRGSSGSQKLCLKVVRIFEESDSKRFLKVVTKEAILWGQLKHPNVVSFYGVYFLGPSPGRVCLVLPWMDNGDLTAYLKTNPLVPRAPFIHDVINGLAYLHDENIIHGDLKGTNVLVNRDGRAGITDFGLATVLTNNTFGHTNGTSVTAGSTYRWLAPELIIGSNRRTKASDLIAILFINPLPPNQILGRKVPFHESQQDYQVFPSLFENKIPTRPQKDVIPAEDYISDEMWAILITLWVKEPSKRPTCPQISAMLLQSQLRMAREGNHGCETSVDISLGSKKGSHPRVDSLKVKQILTELTMGSLSNIQL